MRRAFTTIALVGLLLGSTAACDRAPTDLSTTDIDSLLAASSLAATDARSFGSALPALFREAIAKVEKEQGGEAVEDLLADWRRLQNELMAEAGTASRQMVEAKLAAIHNEELHVVQRALGTAVIGRLVTETNIGIAEALQRIEDMRARGLDVSRISAQLAQVRAGQAATIAALTIHETQKALERAAEAAGLLTGLRYQLVEMLRVPGLESLLPQALAQMSRQQGPDAADAAISGMRQLDAQTQQALRVGDRGAVHASLARLRAEQIRIVDQTLGPGAAPLLVQQVDARAQEVRAALDEMEAAGGDVARNTRMLQEAVDLNRRAALSLQKGDRATALDLSSHAAGLLNALQHLTWH